MSEMLEKARKYEDEQGKQIKAEDTLGQYALGACGK